MSDTPSGLAESSNAYALCLATGSSRNGSLMRFADSSLLCVKESTHEHGVFRAVNLMRPVAEAHA